jgi:hypothetical protein
VALQLVDINHLARLVPFHTRYDCLDYGSHRVAALGIVALLIILAILSLFAGWFPF